MRFSIEGFSQARLCRLGIGLQEAVLLRWLVDFSHTGKMRELVCDSGEQRRTLYWVNYAAVIRELPILGIKDKEWLAERFKKLVKAGVMIHKTVRKGGVFSFYGFGPAYAELISDDEVSDLPVDSPEPLPAKTPEPYRSNSLNPTGENTGTKTPLLEDPSTSDPREDDPPPAAAVPGKKAKVRDEDWKMAADLTVERGGHWAAGVKEAVCMDRLVLWCQVQQPEHWQRFLRDFLDGAWALISGDVHGMTDKDRAFWAKQPYTPSRLLSNAMAICATLKAIAPGNRKMSFEDIKSLCVGMKLTDAKIHEMVAQQ